MKIRNVIFSSLFCIFLCGPIALFGAQKIIGIDISSDLSSESASWLSGGTENVDVRSVANLEGFYSKELQATAETEIENYIPAKAYALLENASLQRSMIEVSNSLFHWRCYPTFYGSSLLFIPEENALTRIPPKVTEDAGIEGFAQELDKYARARPNINFALYVVPENDNFSIHSPAIELVSNPLTFDAVISQFQNALSNTSSIKLIYPEFESLHDYYQCFFTTDLHWNIRGASHAAQQIIQTLGLVEMPSGSFNTISDIPFTGTESRRSLLLLGDKMEDYTFDDSDLHIDGEGDKHYPINQHEQYWNASLLDKQFNAYCYFIDIENTTIKGGKGTNKVLLVTDSLGAATQRILAYSTSELTHCNALRGEKSSDHVLSEQIRKNDIDTVIFMGRPSDYASFIERNPSYFL